jgi:hypothetical protein
MRPALSLIVALAACNADCPTISERFELDNPDSDLQALVDDCVAHKATPPGEICVITNSPQGSAIQCGCLPLCQRVLEIANQFPGTPTIETCSYSQPAASSPDGGARPPGTVYVTYRMVSCS